MPTSALPLSSSRRSDNLIWGASWALSHGDAGGLAQVVADLAQGFTGELEKELREELLELSLQCHVDYDGAAARWPRVCARAQAVLGSAQPREPAASAAGSSESLASSLPAAEPLSEAELVRPTILPVPVSSSAQPSSERVTQPITPRGRRRFSLSLRRG